ncbi:MAG TPA: sensor histidine kinase [Acidobacteriaceae bacterium]|jgi:two-component system sensor histidine kinase DesK|nr:sensor histidine kinase [Acidobacteriaceae bacterium]
MSEGWTGTRERDAAPPDAHIRDAKRQFVLGRWIVRGVALLYAAYMFGQPAYRHSFGIWVECAVFYAVLLVLFFLTAELTGRRQTVAFVLYFIFAFLYYPVNQGAYAIFVYPFAMLCLFLTRLRTFFLVLVVLTAGVVAETRYFGHHLAIAEEILFFCVIIGLTNFAFSQQERTNVLLEQANSKIERLTKEAERERIARDLHDLLGHTLTVITVKLDLARRLLSRDADRARNEMVEAEQTARNALAEVRDAVSGYRAEGLGAEIQRARRSLLAADVQLTTMVAAVRLSPDQVQVLCLALREAVTNIVRHAQAAVCRVGLVEENATVHFTIEDDGLGGPIREGNGLRGMRERLHSMGASLKVTGSGNRGTILEITFPLESAASAQPSSQMVGEADPL